MRVPVARAACLAAPILLAGCSREAASALDPRGPRAAAIAELWWILAGTGGVVFAVVTTIVLLAVLRTRRGSISPGLQEESPAAGLRLIVLGGVVIPAVILAATLFFTFRALRALAAPEARGDFTIEVVGRQWWWEVRYPDHGFVTANEIHVPVGRPVTIRLIAADVIHSFWVPQLQGKLDLVPGRTNTTWLQADQAGVYRGPCAEYCGTQHAKMYLFVVAEPPEQFAAWAEAQRRPAEQPTEPAAIRGAAVFARVGCINCHAIRYGDRAEPREGHAAGPDLTHLASRRTLAAGALENNRGSLAGWIANPQALKPGNLMPNLELSAEDLHLLLRYLERLE